MPRAGLRRLQPMRLTTLPRILGLLLTAGLAALTPELAAAKAGGTASALPAVSDVYQRVAPTVAYIETVDHDLDASAPGQLVTTGGISSGVIISKDGLVLTAAHVVQTADEIRVSFDPTDRIKAEVVRSIPAADIALLKLEYVPPDLKPAKLADSDKTRVGEPIFIIGAPLGISQTLTVGHVSARREPDSLANGISFAELFQTDAAINQGNSGGPMFNLRGEVVGVVSHMISLSGSYEGLGFAVTSNAARELLMKPGAVWSGLRMQPISGRLAELFNLPQAHGLLVERIARGSAGARLGLREGTTKARIAELELIIGGDIILEILGVQFAGRDSLELIRQRLAALKQGQPFTMKVLRGGVVKTLSAPYDPSLFRRDD